VRPHFSPDGTRLAITLNRDVWAYDWQRDITTRLTFEGDVTYSAWSPDARYLVFQSPNGGMSWTRGDGAGKPQPLTRTINPEWPWSFSPDGHRLAYQEQAAQTGWDIWTVPIQDAGGRLQAGQPEVFLQTPFNDRNPAFSPDGRWIAYSSTESGAEQVYVRAFPDTGGKWLISNGRQPVWSRASRELLFRSEDNQIMLAPYTVIGDSFVAEKVRPWSETRIANVNLNGTYDLASDGKRVAALLPADTAMRQQAQNRVILLENFFDELQRILSSAKR
jgi:eukaryotic-like serine/threonine-protein kinase